MPVIFKEKRYDQLVLILKKTSIIFLILFIFVTIFNFNFNNKIKSLDTELEAVKAEGLKYNSLIRELNQNKGSNSIQNKYYSILIKLANYAEEITYNSLHYKNNKIRIDGVSSQQKSMMRLIDTLKLDKKFKNADLININQQDKLYFQLELMLFQ